MFLEIVRRVIQRCVRSEREEFEQRAECNFIYMLIADVREITVSAIIRVRTLRAFYTDCNFSHQVCFIA